MEPLPPRDQRHLWLRYQVEGYTEEILYDFEQTLKTIFGRQIGSEMGLDVADTLCFQLGGARRSMTLRQFILALVLHTAEEMVEDGFGAYWLGSERVIPDKGDLSGYWIEISSDMDILRSAPSYLHQRSGSEAAPQYLFRHAKGRKSGARLSGGHFIRRLAHHFGLVSDDGLRGLSVVTRELPLIDMAPMDAEDAFSIDVGAQAIPAPIHAPPPPLLPVAAGFLFCILWYDDFDLFVYDRSKTGIMTIRRIHAHDAAYSAD
nr:hypothetical protein [Tanacetum cinerariifolium]